MKLEFICENDNIRLSEELKQHVSRKLYKNIKSSNTQIYVNGVITKTYIEIKKGDKIELTFDKEKDINWPIYECNLKVYYEDDNYLVVYKRGNLLTIPTKAEPFSLYQEVLYYLKCKGLPLSVSILNRLDKDTKGLVVIAKNRYAANKLSPTHEKMCRKYLCICYNKYASREGIIDTYIEKYEDSNKRYISSSGKRAISHYRVIEEYDDTSLVEYVLETGRTHQIRLHSSYNGCPLVGDPLYGDDYNNSLKLLSYYISFINPFTNEVVEIKLEGDEINEAFK